MKKKFLFYSILTISMIVLFNQASYGQDKYLKKVQESLTILGYNPGVADGYMGEKTKAAISEFEKNVGLPITGKDSEKLHDYLFVYSLPITKKTDYSGNTVFRRDDGSGACNYSFEYSDGGSKNQLTVGGDSTKVDTFHAEIIIDEHTSESCIVEIKKQLAKSFSSFRFYNIIMSKAGWCEFNGVIGVF